MLTLSCLFSERCMHLVLKIYFHEYSWNSYWLSFPSLGTGTCVIIFLRVALILPFSAFSLALSIALQLMRLVSLTVTSVTEKKKKENHFLIAPTAWRTWWRNRASEVKTRGIWVTVLTSRFQSADAEKLGVHKMGRVWEASHYYERVLKVHESI